MLKLLTLWLVPSFSQHSSKRLVVLRRRLLVAVTKFQDKIIWTFGVNRTGLIAKISIKYVLPTSIWKYFWQISRYFAEIPEFHGSTTTRNIRSPDLLMSFSKTRMLLFHSTKNSCFVIDLLHLLHLTFVAFCLSFINNNNTTSTNPSS